MSYERRLQRIKNAFHAFRDPNRRLPTYMQMHDLFPLTESTDTHYTMEHSHNRSAYGDVNSNYTNIFAQSDAARQHTNNVYREFASVMNC